MRVRFSFWNDRSFKYKLKICYSWMTLIFKLTYTYGIFSATVKWYIKWSTDAYYSKHQLTGNKNRVRKASTGFSRISCLQEFNRDKRSCFEVVWNKSHSATCRLLDVGSLFSVFFFLTFFSFLNWSTKIRIFLRVLTTFYGILNTFKVVLGIIKTQCQKLSLPTGNRRNNKKLTFLVFFTVPQTKTITT